MACPGFQFSNYWSDPERGVQVLSPAGDAYKVVAPLLNQPGIALFLSFTISLAASQIRLYIQAVLILITAGFVAFRTIHLRTNGTGAFSGVLVSGVLWQKLPERCITCF